ADMRFVKPLDIELVKQLSESHDLLVTVEENAIMGGAGSGVLEELQRLKRPMPVLQIGLPDEFIKHGEQKEILADLRLDSAGILAQIEEYLK
ncbi:MAG: 1-deoxy-D-xylulose-5-phosphate synthase, partial [Shewanella sp.]|nr:1-deoxy-D-xylulose-5-phosphate synthase [Shewanella sp.]